MPATDSCEPQVIRALQKEGWKVLEQHYHIYLGINKGSVYADLLIQKAEKQLLVVEIKCFADQRSLMDELYHGIGQYLIYRTALELKRLAEPVYLALPTHAYARLVKHDAIRLTLEGAKINLIIIDMDQQEIEQWIHRP